MEEKKKKGNKDLKYIKSVWHKLPWWLQIKIAFITMWYAKTYWIRQIPMRWIKYQIEKERGQNEDLLH
ncbi:MAG: hypothetical protein HS100_05070 [Anaerolineales bacterium]|nr:hypothetical protein [Anaerolineales bacterium]